MTMKMPKCSISLQQLCPRGALFFTVETTYLKKKFKVLLLKEPEILAQLQQPQYNAHTKRKTPARRKSEILINFWITF